MIIVIRYLMTGILVEPGGVFYPHLRSNHTKTRKSTKQPRTKKRIERSLEYQGLLSHFQLHRPVPLPLFFAPGKLFLHVGQKPHVWPDAVADAAAAEGVRRAVGAARASPLEQPRRLGGSRSSPAARVQVVLLRAALLYHLPGWLSSQEIFFLQRAKNLEIM